MNDDRRDDVAPLSTIVAFLVIAATIVGGAALLLATQPEPVRITINPPAPTATPAPSATPAPVTVYVTGAVMQPESMLNLPAGSRVQDALEAAGGTTGEADLERVNLARVVYDGDQIHVPARGEVVVSPTPGGVVHINRATPEELMLLPGIGPALAQRIIDYREANGPFASLAGLDAVTGIGPSLLEQLEGLVVFD